MNVAIISAVVALALYILAKLFVYCYRSELLEKVPAEIEEQYAKLLRILDADIATATEDLQHWRVGEKDKIMRVFVDEEKLTEAAKNAHDEKAHAVGVHEKYVRLRERFLFDRKKMAEVQLAYRRYLFLRLKHIQDADTNTQALEFDSVTIDEWRAAADESRVAIQEAERRLDVLLGHRAAT